MDFSVAEQEMIHDALRDSDEVLRAWKNMWRAWYIRYQHSAVTNRYLLGISMDVK